MLRADALINNMKIFVKSKPSSKKEAVEKIDGKNFIVAVKDPPVKGKANRALVKTMAKYFDVPSSSVQIVSGHTSKQKIIEISK